ncbi:MAG: ferredoxin [Spirochaetales bacterium]|nr:ferredoxin [Spirochaetales bacterium]
MADKNNKVNGNISGKYYTDNNCTGCGLCESEAPENFKLNDDGIAIVIKQPSNDSENEQCKSALESCPVDAIGDNG